MPIEPRASLLRPGSAPFQASHVVPVVAVPAIATTRGHVPSTGRWLPAGAPLGARPLLALAHDGYRIVERSGAYCDVFRRPFTHVVATPDGRTFLAILRH